MQGTVSLGRHGTPSMIWPILRCLENLLWKFRMWLANYPVPMDLKGWMPPEDFERAYTAWQFLKPFFASRGYLLYCDKYPTEYSLPILYPDPTGHAPPSLPGYPFARYMCRDDSRAQMSIPAPTVYAGRDFEGRDVMIKIISDSTETNELKVLRALNSSKLRKDPRNHTIVVLDFITFQGLTFVVMPRWPPAFHPDFGTVGEMMSIAGTIFETIDFLHENRIAHGDFLPQNIGINVINDAHCEFPEGMRDPSAVKYALYDFGASFIYPAETNLQDVREKPIPRDAPFITERNPFQEDLAEVARALERYLRLIGHIVPDLIVLVEKLKAQGPEYSFTARMAWNEFRRINATLSQDDLSRPVSDRWWNRRNGTITTKAQRPSRRFEGGQWNVLV